MLLLLIIGVCSVLIPLVTGLILFSRLSSELKLLLFLFFIAAAVEGCTFYLAMNDQNPYWIHHIYMPFEYAMIALIFSFWQRKSWEKKLLRLSIPPFIILCLWDILNGGDLKDLNAFTASVAYTLYVGISSYTLVNLNHGSNQSIAGDCRFWIATALLIYSAGGIAYFSFHDMVVTNYLIEIWVIHTVLNIIAYVLYSIGIVCKARSWNQVGV
jgi:hypothetical protein